jgi:hypothetical protein
MFRLAAAAGFRRRHAIYCGFACSRSFRRRFCRAEFVLNRAPAAADARRCHAAFSPFRDASFFQLFAVARARFFAIAIFCRLIVFADIDADIASARCRRFYADYVMPPMLLARDAAPDANVAVAA